MHALIFDGESVRLEKEWSPPQPAAGEVRVAVRLAGICATDLEIARGYMAFRGVPGHEFVGVALDGPLAGRRVVGEINAACMRCDACRRGLDRHCPERTVLGIQGRDGAFAPMLRLPERNLLPVDDAVPDEAAVFTEPLAAAFAILEQVPEAARARVAVLGDGRLGLLCAAALASAGADVTLVGRHREKLALTPHRGVHLVQWTKGTPCDTLLRALGARFPFVVDATGSPLGMKTALDLVEPRGTIVMKTTTCDAPSESLARIVIDEIRVVGSRCGRFGPALEALASRRIDPRPLVQARFPIDRGLEAFERAGAGGAIKVLLEFPTP